MDNLRFIENRRRTNKRDKASVAAERIRSTLGISHVDFADMLRMDSRSYAEMSAGKAPLPALGAVYLAEKYHLSIEKIVQGQIDYTALAKHVSGEVDYLSERYTSVAFSWMRTVHNFGNYLEAMGLGLVFDNALRQLQVNPAAIIRCDRPVNVRFTIDFVTLLESQGVERQIFFSLGRQVLVKLLKGQRIERNLSLGDAFEWFFSHLVEQFEKNSCYSVIRVNANCCEVVSYPNQDILSALEIPTVTTPSTCLYKKGIFSRLAEIVSGVAVDITEDRCVHRGDEACRFLVSSRNSMDR